MLHPRPHRLLANRTVASHFHSDILIGGLSATTIERPSQMPRDGTWMSPQPAVAPEAGGPARGKPSHAA